MTKALVERWTPHPNWGKMLAIAPQARYVSPYEEAYRLLRIIQQSGYHSPWNLVDLERLSNLEIEAQLPAIRGFHRAIAPLTA
jgi:hypothetical protein